MPHMWTGEEYDRLPDDNVRRELVDGILIVSAGPTVEHQRLVVELAVALDRNADRNECRAVPGVGVKLGDLLRFIPDIVVVTAQADRRRRSQFFAHEVILAVEIESPSSRSFDRMLKPSHYAIAGIPLLLADRVGRQTNARLPRERGWRVQSHRYLHRRG
jgi:Uma2 family endonuclease